MQQLCLPAVYQRGYAAQRYGRKDNPGKEGGGIQIEKMKQAVVFHDLVKFLLKVIKHFQLRHFHLIYYQNILNFPAEMEVLSEKNR